MEAYQRPQPSANVDLPLPATGATKDESMPGPYLTPGVYIEEMPSGSKPIQGVGTAVAAFLGFTQKRPLGNEGQPVFISSWTDYEEQFGSFVAGFYTPLAIYGYFMNGG